MPPNYTLHLKVAAYINEKKANNPRDAATLIARLACNRNAHVALLSLATLVTSCGYPFHLQISTKELVNELVRRFPWGLTAPQPSPAQSCPAFRRLSRAGRRPSALSPQRVPLPSCPLRSPLRLLAPQPSQLVPTPVPLEHGPSAHAHAPPPSSSYVPPSVSAFASG
ncbi:hypothetical protein B0H14DRAFT_2790029 [Mycena olivaceomarginata]|nr:hypothetical protein B0H14DRAFT_2790029 [Mycena olivaceomarginata]